MLILKLMSACGQTLLSPKSSLSFSQDDLECPFSNSTNRVYCEASSAYPRCSDGERRRNCERGSCQKRSQTSRRPQGWPWSLCHAPGEAGAPGQRHSPQGTSVCHRSAVVLTPEAG